MDYAKESLRLHSEWRGKLEVTPRAQVDSKEALSLAYTPGVAQPCLEIQKDTSKSYELTRRWNTVRRGHRRLRRPRPGRHRPGGGHARHGGQMRPVQGLCGRGRLSPVHPHHDVDEIVNTVALLAGSLRRHQSGGHLRAALLRDRAQAEGAATSPSSTTTSTAPPSSRWRASPTRCAWWASAGGCRIVVNGAGAAAISIASCCLTHGRKHRDALSTAGRHLRRPPDGMNWLSARDGQVTNPENVDGTLADALKGADVFIGVSAPDL